MHAPLRVFLLFVTLLTFSWFQTMDAQMEQINVDGEFFTDFEFVGLENIHLAQAESSNGFVCPPPVERKWGEMPV